MNLNRITSKVRKRKVISFIAQVVPANGGGGVGGGTVTSVSGLSPLFTTANPTTVPTFTLINQSANLVFAGPTAGQDAAPSFRALVAADIPSLSGTYLPLGGGTLTGKVTFNGASSTSAAIKIGSTGIAGTPTGAANGDIYLTSNNVIVAYSAGNAGVIITSVTGLTAGRITFGAGVGTYVTDDASLTYSTSTGLSTTKSISFGANANLVAASGFTLGVGTAGGQLLSLFANSVTVITISGSVGISITDAFPFIFGTTNGTKLGTGANQKMSIYGKTTIVQPTTSIASATRVAGSGASILLDDTYDGYKIDQAIKAMVNFGLLA